MPEATTTTKATALAAATLAATVLAACGTGSDAAAPGAPSASTTPASTSASAPAPGVGLGEPAAAACTFTGSLKEFYTPPSPLPSGPPGTLVRCQQRTDIKGLTDATAYRVLYLTEAPTVTKPYQPGYSPGRALTPRVSGGMVFVPTAAAPAGGRRIVAWDHGTVGMGTSCAPSRGGYGTITPVTPTSKPTMSFGFVQNMLDKNWVVAATDYAGLGIEPNRYSLQYLVGVSEAMDTLNMVRAAVAFPGSGVTDPAFAVYGQSQGGHASLFTGGLARSYAPELRLVGVAASDPAAQMVMLVGKQWDKTISWVLGPEIVIAWPKQNTALSMPLVVTQNALTSFMTIANDCITDAALAALAKKGTFFTQAITTNKAWLQMAADQTPPVVSDLPVLVGQTTNDGVVLASTTANLQTSWCAAGSDLSMYWVKGTNPTPDAFLNGALSHITSASVDALATIAWIDGLFTGSTAPVAGVTPCTTPPPSPLS